MREANPLTFGRGSARVSDAREARWPGDAAGAAWPERGVAPTDARSNALTDSSSRAMDRLCDRARSSARWAAAALAATATSAASRPSRASAKASLVIRSDVRSAAT